MENIQNYKNLTRGCVLDTENGEKQCIHSVYDIKHSFDWAKDLKTIALKDDLVEVRFKNGRKGIFWNHEDLFLQKGDVVAVETISGHDIGLVDLQGESVYWQIKKYDNIPEDGKFPKIYRKARLLDYEKWNYGLEREANVLKRSKEIVSQLNLKMKLGDVEFQGDSSKATFFYTADERVDFRELIKILASEFKIRVEMRQIGARQESSKIGGIGTCGRELCCISWKKSFESVTTNAARTQELSLNPTKLAGQCGKLKCCLNYEIDAYKEAKRNFPNTSIPLKTKEGKAFFQKSDVFKKLLWYSLDPHNSVNIVPLSSERVAEIIEMNKNKEFPDTLLQNNLKLADLISSKHNIQISEEEIQKNKIEDKKNNRKRKPRTNYKKNNRNNKKNNHNINTKNKK